MKVEIELYLYKDGIYIQVENGNYDSFYAVAALGNFSRVFITYLNITSLKKKKKKKLHEVLYNTSAIFPQCIVHFLPLSIFVYFRNGGA